MSHHPLWSRAGLAAGASLVALCTSLITSGAASASTTTAATTTPAAAAAAKTDLKSVCAAPTTINQEQCQVFLQNRAKKASGLSAADTSPLSGAYTPANLQSAYDLATAAAANGAGTTVSIVDAYRDPNVVTDLAAYRSEYGLPACDSATGEGCVTTYSETGGSASSVPVDPTGGWEVEESLDVDMVSAICPLCHLALYEANSTALTDLGPAENTAAKASKFVSNSWGGLDYPGESANDTVYFNHPGVVTAFASGDDGYGAGYPASSELVTSVGGTDLTGSTGDWSQTVWNNADGATESGCSSGEPKPAWQTDTGSTGCANRTENDVSAVADGPDGISIYDSYDSSTTCGGWCSVGGTSAATPIITSVYALAGTPAANTYPSSYLYQNEGAGLTRITSGNDSVSAGGSTYTCESDRQYLCNAADSLSDGYNGPTGWGTPNGADLSAFTNTSTDVVSAINPGTYDLQAGVSYALPAIEAYDSAGNAVTYSATGLPSGLTINSSTGAISGKLSSTPATSAVTVTVSDGSAASNISFDIVSIASLDTDYHAVSGAVHLDLDNKCMDDTNNSSANLNKVQIYTCNGEASQNWTYEPDTEPGTAGVVEHNGKCLDVHRGGTTNGTLLDLYSCNGSGSQQWYLTGDLGELYNPQSGKCAEDPYSSTVNGRQLDIWTCNAGDNQAWTVPASPAQSGVTGKCLDDKGASSANGNIIDSYSCNGQASQKWTLGLDETLKVEGKCLDATGLGTTDGTLAQLWNCNDGVNQVWYITGTGEIENLNSEKCLADPGNSTTNTTQLALEDCTGQPGEIWAQS